MFTAAVEKGNEGMWIGNALDMVAGFVTHTTHPACLRNGLGDSKRRAKRGFKLEIADNESDNGKNQQASHDVILRNMCS